jgi:hypothetical protein
MKNNPSFNSAQSRLVPVPVTVPASLHRRWSRFLFGLLSGSALFAAAVDARAYTNGFDTASSINGWVHWWGGAVETVAYDTTKDAGNNPGSGSIRVEVPFNRSLGGDNQFSSWLSFSGTPNSWTARLDGTLYSHLEMDIFWDPFSPTIPSSGNYSSDFHWGFAVGDPVYGQISFDNHTVITAAEGNTWIHLSMPLDPTVIGPNLTNIVGIWLKMWTGNDVNNSLNDGTATFWVDNIRLRALPPPPPDYVQNFDTADALAGWVHWWGGATETREFDPTKDANGSPNSGAMKVTVPYSRSLGGDNQFSMWGSFSGSPNSWGAPIDGTGYTNIEMSVYWDPTSPIRPATGDYGSDFRYGFAVGQPIYGQISFNNHTTIAASEVGQWFKVSSPIDLAAVGENITNIVGIWLKMWTGNDPNNSLNDGNAVFWVDNIKLSSKGVPTAAPKPEMAITKSGPTGLKLFANATGAQYQRQGIRTINPTYSWVGALDPVSYSVTIDEHPYGKTPDAGAFQTHIFLLPGGTVPATDNSPDYGQPHVVFLDIHGNADGSGYASFRYKTNEPGANSFLYGAGTIADIGSSTVLGTWNMTFNPGGVISLTSPSGAITNFSMPPEAVSLFSGPLHAYFGVQPNQPGNIGLSATWGRVTISGVATPIDEEFSNPTLNPSFWEVHAQSASGVVLVPGDALLWLSWKLPDIGFILQTSTILTADWTDLPLPSLQVGANRQVLVRQGNLPPSDSGNYFFRLRKSQ